MKNLEQSNLSRSQIESIQKKGELSSDLDEFNKDAAKGWLNSQTNISVLKNLDKKYAYKSSNEVYKSIIILNALLFVFLYFMGGFSSEKINLTSDKKQNKNSIVEKTDIEIPRKIESLTILSSPKRIKLNEIKAKFIQGKLADKESAKEVKNTTEQKTEGIILNIKKVEELEAENNTVLLKKNKKGAETYLNDLLVLDYRKYRTRPKITTERLIISGTPASMENQHQKEESLNEWEKIDIPYIDYLEKTTSLFAKGKYKKALTRYIEVLKTYPDDLNSFFYGGLCYYNLGDYQNALSFFQKSEAHEFSNFTEDSKWYEAKTYLALKENDKAFALLHEISKNGSYYATQAKTLLIKIGN